MPRTSLAILVLLTWACSACRPELQRATGYTASGAAWFIDPVPARAIGQSDEIEFGEIGGLGMLADGSVVVVDQSVPSVVIYPASGVEAVHLGGVGSGPGEYREPNLIDVASNGDVTIYDPALRRIGVYRRDGTSRRSVSWTPASDDGLRSTPVGMLPGGLILAVRMRWPKAKSVGEVVRVVAQVAGCDADGHLRTDFGTYPYGDWLTGLAGNTPIVGPRWLGWRLYVAHSGELVAVGASQSYAATVLAANGQLRGTIEEPHAPLLAAAVDREPILAMAASHHASPTVTAPGTFADTLPAFGNLLVDNMGFIWISSFPSRGDRPDSVDVFASTGQKVAALELPPRFRLGAITDSSMVGVAFDSNDVGAVVVYRLRRGGPTH